MSLNVTVSLNGQDFSIRTRLFLQARADARNKSHGWAFGSRKSIKVDGVGFSSLNIILFVDFQPFIFSKLLHFNSSPLFR